MGLQGTQNKDEAQSEKKIKKRSGGKWLEGGWGGKKKRRRSESNGKVGPLVPDQWKGGRRPGKEGVTKRVPGDEATFGPQRQGVLGKDRGIKAVRRNREKWDNYRAVSGKGAQPFRKKREKKGEGRFNHAI